MKSESMKWIELAKAVSDNPFRRFSCPNYNDHYISITLIPWQQEEKVDVHLVCDECDIRNVYTKKVVTCLS